MRRGLRLLGLAAALALQGLPDTTRAQDRSSPGCILDRCQDRDGPQGQSRPAPPPGPRATGTFDFYVLSLSWSSGFCATSRGGRDSDQCRRGAGLGFVVHGLWPQNERGYPENCDTAGRPLSRQALDMAQGLFPDEGLARYEWRKHGTCTGLSPADYFASVRRARQQVTIPDLFDRMTRARHASPADVIRAFEAANPRLRPGMMAVGCARGVLQEVRICLSKDLRDFRPCREVVQQSCRSGDITIPPVL